MNPAPSHSRHPSLEGRVVLVTGGASGIGAAIVERFVADGARVAFVDRDRAAGEALAARLAPGAANAPHFAALDLTDLDAIGPAFAAIAAALGPIGILVNNAAHDERHAIEDVTPAFWRDRLAVNLDHQFFCAKAVIPAMKAAGRGVILNMGSCSWRLGLGGMPAYVTAKAAIEGLTRGLARDLGPAGIRVCCVVPGFVKTQRQVEKWLTPELERTIHEGQCLKTLIEPADVAALVAFLASDDARMLTNQTYAIDAGWM
jgi:NAD(P)-dependent dehydrogenase (short-subunit alcohol dehydrogenase family)